MDAALLDVGEGHVELLAPLGPDTPVGSTWPSAARGCTTSPTRWRTSTPARAPARGGPAPHRRDSASGHSQLPRGVPPPGGGRRRADRDRPAGGGRSLMAIRREVTIGFQGGQALGRARRAEDLQAALAPGLATAAGRARDRGRDRHARPRRSRLRARRGATSTGSASVRQARPSQPSTGPAPVRAPPGTRRGRTAVRSFSRLGEHAAAWLGLGAAGAASTERPPLALARAARRRRRPDVP